MPNEELAHVVALEWDSQEEYINPVSLGTTQSGLPPWNFPFFSFSLSFPLPGQGLLFAASLCNVVLDHPSNMTRDQRVEQLLPYFQTDTVSFRPSESDTQVLYDHVVGLWDPICDWFDKVGLLAVWLACRSGAQPFGFSRVPFISALRRSRVEDARLV